VLAGVNRLIEKVEESLLPLLHAVPISKQKPRDRDHSRLKIDHLLRQIDSEASQLLQLVAVFQLAHQRIDAAQLLGGVQYGCLRDLFPAHLIKIIWDSSQGAELWKEVSWVGAFHLYLNF
jgi:DNA helicase IV